MNFKSISPGVLKQYRQIQESWGQESADRYWQFAMTPRTTRTVRQKDQTVRAIVLAALTEEFETANQVCDRIPRRTCIDHVRQELSKMASSPDYPVERTGDSRPFFYRRSH